MILRKLKESKKLHGGFKNLPAEHVLRNMNPKGGLMHSIRLDDSKINMNGKWLSVDDLKEMISRKMESGDMKFADLAAALEALNTALENACTIEETLVLSKKEYQKLKELGGDDDQASVRKAVMAYIGKDKETSKANGVAEGRNAIVKCTKCMSLLEVPSAKRPIVLDCPKCGTSFRLTV